MSVKARSRGCLRCTRVGPTCSEGSSRSIPDTSALPAPVGAVFESAFGDGTAYIFMLATPFAVAALVCVLFIREVPLRETIQREDEIEADRDAEAARA